MSLIVNRRDLEFILYEFLGLENICNRSPYDAYDKESVDAILDVAQRIAEEKYLEFAAKIDTNEPQFVDGRAITPKETKEALKAFSEAGFFAAGFAEQDGGLSMPNMLQIAVYGLFSAANLSVHNYAMLTIAAANLLDTFAIDEYRKKYLQKMLEGRWYGTMCISEPQAGSSVADIKTKATPTDSEYYSIQGSKMWISGGDQDISDNIIHMVLARIPGSPAGVKGLSLFLVPKYIVEDDNSLGTLNNISLAGLNHKMGNRGTTNTLLNFGETGLCKGWLIGEANQGLKYMFHMMNEARIAVGHGACMLGLSGFLYSLSYAKERLQGRPITDKNPASPQIPIIEHSDVKRLLLSQKSFVEGGMALVFYCSRLVDLISLEKDQQKNKSNQLLLDLLTPVAKSWPSEYCLEANKDAIQILGGYGYTIDYPVERFYRDNRLNHIHEGTHAIQAIDLLGRKVRMNNGAAFERLKTEIKSTISKTEKATTHQWAAEALHNALSLLSDTTEAILNENDVETALANATLYLNGFGHIVVAWLWLKKAILAQEALTKPSVDTEYYEGKIKAFQYFFRYELPKAHALLEISRTLDKTCMNTKAEEFTGY